MYLRRTDLVAKLYPRRTWTNVGQRPFRLTFDDGPHPDSTPYLLDELDRLHQKATFFCLGHRIQSHPALYRDILSRGHDVGNHTYSHVDGWRTDTDQYIDEVQRCAALVDSNLFRPPYGRLKRGQEEELIKRGYEIIMWTVMPGDWQVHRSIEDVVDRTLRGGKAEDMIVLHDNGDRRLVQIVNKLIDHREWSTM